MSATLEGVRFCEFCGDRLPRHGAAHGYCGGCARKFDALVAPAEDDVPPRRDPLLATVLSAALPGGGQVYNRHFVKALLVFVFSPLVFPYVIGIADAFFSARRANAQHARRARGAAWRAAA